MGRYTGPSCKICRREGMKLFLKGDRCFMAKCAVDQGRSTPGQHGGNRRSKISDYGTQLREKQKLRKMYGMLEKPFRIFFNRSARKKGVTGENLLQLLEMRLDNVVYRLGFVSSRKGARLFVNHGHVLVNGKKASIPSMTLKAGDVVVVKDNKKSRDMAGLYVDAAESRGIVPWLKLDKTAFKGEVDHVPSREEINPTVNEQLVVELYSK